MKYLIGLITLFSLIAIGFGLYKQGNDFYAEKFIGFGTAGLFLVAMPLFLLYRSKKKKMEDYMLTKKNIEKMRRKEKDFLTNSKN